MKKSFLLITAVSALTMLVSCSNEDEQYAQTDTDMDALANAPVEIRLGTPSVSVTRAAIDDVEGIDLGVFCLARSRQNGEALPGTFSWNSTADACVLKNILTAKNGENLAWKDGQARFYPYYQTYVYDFYAYYPYVPDLDFDTDDNVYAHYELDGKTDILWGREANSAQYAYSAKFFRQEGNSTVIPQIQLDHMLTRLRFWLVPSEDAPGSNTYNNVDGAKVVSLSVVDVVKNVSLLVAGGADRENTSDSKNSGTNLPGRLIASGTEKATLSLCNEDGTAVSEVAVPATSGSKVQLGESLLLFPAMTYTMQITLEKGGVTYMDAHEFTLSIPESTFAAGKVYDIILTITGLNSVSAKASVSAWQDPELTVEQQNSLNQTF